MMNHKILKYITLLAISTKLYAVTPEMVSAVAFVESSNNTSAIGDNGKALGLYQLHKEAWEQVSEQRRNNGQPVYSWRVYAHHRNISTEYATSYLKWISKRLEIKLKRKPLPWEVYASYNCGLTAFIRMNCKFENLPKTTQRACLKIAKLTRSSIQHQ